MPKDKYSYNAVFVVVDYISKQAISVPYYKTVTAKDIARMFIMYVYRYFSAPQSIVSDRGP